MRDGLVTLQQLAELEETTYFAVRKAHQRGRFANVIFQNNQPHVRISDPAVSDKARNRYHLIVPTVPEPAGTFPTERQGGVMNLPASPLTQVPEQAKKIALARLDLVRVWEEYRVKPDHKTKAAADEAFEHGYNGGLMFQGIFEVLGNISIKTLYRWRDDLQGSQDWTKLLPQYFSRGDGIPDLTPDESKLLLNFLLQPNKIKIGTAYRLVKFALEKRGESMDKSPATFRRYAEWFKRNYYDQWILMREGQKALRDKVEPFIERDPSLLNVGDCLVADGHRLNFQVINPFTGKHCRATLVGYLDWKSYDLAGYEIMIEENTQCIAAAMRNSIIRLGKFPTVSYQDNGKAFRAKFFTGCVNLEESGLYGLFGRLNIVPVFAKPYNAKAKIIERWFKEFSDTFERLLPSFIGSSIVDKPAYMMRNEKFHKAIHNQYVPTIEEAIWMIEAWLEFHRSQPCPHVKGKTIGEVFAEGRGTGVNINDLDDLMMDTKITNIRQQGIRFLNEDFYDETLYGLRDQVIIRYSLFDLTHIKVFTMKGEALCIARRFEKTHPLASVTGTPKDMTAVKNKIAQQRRLERQTINLSKSYMEANGRAPELDWQKVVEITPRIIEKIEQADINTSGEVRQIPDEMVVVAGPCACPEQEQGQPQGDAPTEETVNILRLTPPARPRFDENYERYDWHVKNGMHTEEDEAWCNWYMTTNEHKMIYGKETPNTGQITAI